MCIDPPTWDLNTTLYVYTSPNLRLEYNLVCIYIPQPETWIQPCMSCIHPPTWDLHTTLYVLYTSPNHLHVLMSIDAYNWARKVLPVCFTSKMCCHQSKHIFYVIWVWLARTRQRLITYCQVTLGSNRWHGKGYYTESRDWQRLQPLTWHITQW